MNNEFLLSLFVQVSYWFSYDRDALVLKYGKGHVMTETTLLEYHFLKSKRKKIKTNKINVIIKRTNPSALNYDLLL